MALRHTRRVCCCLCRLCRPLTQDTPLVLFEFRAKAFLGRPDEKQYANVLALPTDSLTAGSNTIAVEV
jgi:hypothetical protein